MRGFFVLTGAIVGLLSLSPILHASERVTLRNGFEIRCHHHAPVEGRTRLYLNANEENYQEFAPEEIAGVEFVADPPHSAPRKLSPSASPTARNRTTADVQLSPVDLHQMLANAGQQHNLDVDLLASLVKAESGGNVRAVSRAGARGLMQLMPGTAAQLGVANSFKAEENVRGGTTYLDALLTRYHDNLSLALAAYNAGPAAVDKYQGIPPYRETHAYVARVIHEFNRRVRAREALAKQTIASSSDEK